MGRPPELDPREARDDLPCALCDRADPQVLFHDPPYRVVRCSGCSLVYTLPRLPADVLEAMYQEDYWQSESAQDFGYTDYLGDDALYLRSLGIRARHVASLYPPPGTVLEVGCASGCSLAAFAEQGYDVRGVELSAPMAARAGQRVGAQRVRAGGIEAAEFGIDAYDLVVMWDVVEHVEDPVALMRAAHDRLVPGGHLVLSTQNVESPFARLLGRRWHHFKHQEHLYHFAPSTITRLLERAGLETEGITWRRAGKYVSLDFIVERSSRLHPAFRPVMGTLRRLGNPALYVNLADEMFVTARRP